MMNFRLAQLLLIVASVFLASCSMEKQDIALVDKNANDETIALAHSLKKLEGEHTLFGHHATLAYGVEWADEENRSDVKDVSGSFPAVYGWDLLDFLHGKGTSEQKEARIQRNANFVKQGYERGGVITYAWHAYNPKTGKSFYDTTSAVHSILPGQENHQILTQWLDSTANYFNTLAPIPIIFRPWHEHNGDWFWWCKASTKEEDYIALWRFTVEYLRDVKKVHNLLYAFSPDRSRMDISDPESYYYGYPGDEYVDIIGLDNYWDVGHPANTLSDEENARNFTNHR